MSKRLQTHYPGCWRTHGHEECAERLIRELYFLMRAAYFQGHMGDEWRARAGIAHIHYGEKVKDINAAEPQEGKA